MFYAVKYKQKKRNQVYTKYIVCEIYNFKLILSHFLICFTLCNQISLWMLVVGKISWLVIILWMDIKICLDISSQI
jgi:hypothetical protein